MSRSARFFWVCAVTAVLCFVALAVISKTTLEPEGMLIFDSRFTGYQAGPARDYLAWIVQSPDALATYLGTFRQLDTVFPVLLTAALCGAVWLNTAGANPIRRVLLMGAPGAYLMMDLMENAKVAEMLRSGVEASDLLIRQASTFTVMKWILLFVAVLVLANEWLRARKKGMT